MNLRRWFFVACVSIFAASLVGGAASTVGRHLQSIEASRFTATTLADQDLASATLDESETDLARAKGRLTASRNAEASAMEMIAIVRYDCTYYGAPAACRLLADEQSKLEQAERDTAAAGVSLDRAEAAYNVALEQQASASDAVNEAEASSAASGAAFTVSLWISIAISGLFLLASLASFLLGRTKTAT